MNWNKPVQPSTTFYISPNARKYLLMKGANDLFANWLVSIQACVQETLKANADSGADGGFYIGPLILEEFPKFRRLGAVVASASYTLTDENQNNPLIEYTVHIGFNEEKIELGGNDWCELKLERLSKQS